MIEKIQKINLYSERPHSYESRWDTDSILKEPVYIFLHPLPSKTDCLFE